MGKLEGRVAYITGAARGQGRAIALRLAAEGADIIAVDICEPIETITAPLATEEDLAQTAKAVEALDRRIVCFKADVRDFTALKRAADAGMEAFGRLDIVIANAGVGGVGPSWELSEQEWQDMIDVDLTGVWHTAKATIPHIIDGGRGGSIILTSSAAGLKAFPGMSHYVAAKHGVVGLMKTLAVEAAPHMIRVNTVNPTTVNTPMVRNGTLDPSLGDESVNPALRDAAEYFTGWNALKIPWVEAEDVAHAVAFLASDEARYITGVALPVDAGSLVKW